MVDECRPPSFHYRPCHLCKALHAPYHDSISSSNCSYTHNCQSIPNMGGILTRITHPLRHLTVEPVAFLFVLNIYTEYSVVQDMIFTRLCMTELGTDDATSCNKQALNATSLNILSKEQALTMKYYMGIFYFCAILASFFAGSWSDRFGRKPLMMLPSALGIPGEILFILCSLFIKHEWSLIVAYVAAIFHGISGGSTTVVSTCFGYIADITDPKNRTKRVILLEAFFFVGGFCGYQLAGIMMSRVIGKRFEYVFALCAVVHGLIILLASRVKETRGPKAVLSIQPSSSPTGQENTDKALDGIFNFKHVSAMCSTIFKRRPTRCRILLLCLCAVGSNIAMAVQITLVFSFVKASPIAWTSSQYSYYSGFTYLSGGLSLIVVLPIVYHFWPATPDGLVAGWGFLSKAIGLVNLGLSTTTEQVWIGVLLLAFSEYTMPSLRSMLSKAVDEDERGKAFSFLSVLQNVIQFIGTIIFPALYAWSLSFFPGLAFEVAAATQFFAVLLLIIL